MLSSWDVRCIILYSNTKELTIIDDKLDFDEKAKQKYRNGHLDKLDLCICIAELLDQRYQSSKRARDGFSSATPYPKACCLWLCLIFWCPTSSPSTTEHFVNNVPITPRQVSVLAVAYAAFSRSTISIPTRLFSALVECGRPTKIEKKSPYSFSLPSISTRTFFGPCRVSPLADHSTIAMLSRQLQRLMAFVKLEWVHT